MTMIKVGILGMGFIGRGHFSRIASIPDAKVTAVADVEPERRQGLLQIEGNIDLGLEKLDTTGVIPYDSAERLIVAAPVDVVDVCLPTYLHRRYTVAALDAGKHVFCEKPMALTLADADAMLEAAAKSGRLLMIGHCIRFWPEYMYLKKTMDSRELGALLSLRLSRMGTAPAWSWQGWMLDAKRSGGAILDLHVHDVDFMHHLLGNPRAVFAQGGHAGATSGYDFAEAAYQYDHVPRVTVEGGWMLGPLGFQASYDAWFEGGFLCYRGWESPTLTLYRNGEKSGTHPQFEPGDAYTNELRYFLDCVAKRKSPERCLPQSARDSLALIFKEQESIKRKARVKIA